jgi:hypothetical protein
MRNAVETVVDYERRRVVSQFEAALRQAQVERFGTHLESKDRSLAASPSKGVSHYGRSSR